MERETGVTTESGEDSVDRFARTMEYLVSQDWDEADASEYAELYNEYVSAKAAGDDLPLETVERIETLERNNGAGPDFEILQNRPRSGP